MRKTIYQYVLCDKLDSRIIATDGKFYEDLEELKEIVAEKANLYKKKDDVVIEKYNPHPWDCFKDAYFHNVTVQMLYTKEYKGVSMVMGIASYYLG